MSEDSRHEQRVPVLQIVVVGLIASALGIAAGLAIDWFPESASTQAGPVDHLYDVLIWSSVPIFVLVTVVVLFSAWKFRMRPGEEGLDGPPMHGNTRLEVIWTAVPAVILVLLCSYAWIVLNDIEEAQANEMRINVVGQQFAWTFEYPQRDGKPIKSTQLYLPKDQPVRFHVKALDVIHDFWVPAFRMKIDAVPGIETRYRVTPDRLGTFPVVGAELCGLGHAVMRSSARVVTPAEFDTWREEQGAPATATEGGEVDPAEQLFAEGNGAATACGSCHTLGDADTQGQAGPDLDETLPGKDAAYIRESIVRPDAEITPGFQRGIMPKNYGDTLSDEELQALVTYLGKVAGK
ncbi:MAG TPA: cytochrome c oxidase subunit II [Solirubrobacteraceae bacterium]|nr:cytochrome c oxidase subunit II [Solirubrobacteraceae bacterium]